MEVKSIFVELNNLTKSFDNLTAVNNFSLNINKGELVSILGPSGCGKTTTLNMIGGFLEPDDGEIIIENKNITNIDSSERPTATVFQSYALFPHMNVMENVTYGLKVKNYSKKDKLIKGEEMLEMVGLSHYKDKKIGQLSGGEQQRVALARALIMNPKVLLLDEPLSNLDARLRIQMRKEVKDIQSELGITTLYVTHDQEEAMGLSDRVVVMNQGEIEQIGSPEDIYNRPKNEFIADFIGRINKIDNGDNKFYIRPEYIKVVDTDSDVNYEGKVVQKQYRGAFITYFIDYNNTLIQADILKREDRSWKIGEKVNFDFYEDQIIYI